MKQQLELTILMPCLNEAETIVRCIRKARAFLTRSAIAGEVLIADNGSTDGSQALAEANGARVVAIAEPGYGNALNGGIAAALGKYVIMADRTTAMISARLIRLSTNCARAISSSWEIAFSAA
jgi:glycosyltransferase involved in cell wall biosynthesis